MDKINQCFTSASHSEPMLHRASTSQRTRGILFSAGWNIQKKNWQTKWPDFCLGRTCTADVFCTPTRCFAVVKSAYQCGIWLAGIGKSHWSCLPASVCCSTHSDYWDALITFKCEAFWKLNADHDYSFSITLSCVVTAISNLTCYSLFLILFDSSVLLWGLMLFDNSFSKT